MRFCANSHLKTHERRVHNRPKLKCTWNGCVSTFNCTSARLCHIRNKHDPTPYHCDECSRKYTFKRELDHHKRKHQIMKTRKSYQKWYLRPVTQLINKSETLIGSLVLSPNPIGRERHLVRGSYCSSMTGHYYTVKVFIKWLFPCDFRVG